jgi:hypothetical protein
MSDQKVQCQAISVSTGQQCTRTYFPKAGANPNFCHQHQNYVLGDTPQGVISTPSDIKKTRVSAEQFGMMEAPGIVGRDIDVNQPRTTRSMSKLNPVGVNETPFNTEAAPNYGVNMGAEPSRVPPVISVFPKLSQQISDIESSYQQAAEQLGHQAYENKDRVPLAPLVTPIKVEQEEEEEKYQPDVDYQLGLANQVNQNIQSSSSGYQNNPITPKTPAVNPKYLKEETRESVKERSVFTKSVVKEEQRTEERKKKSKESLSRRRRTSDVNLNESIEKIIESGNDTFSGIIVYNSSVGRETSLPLIKEAENITASSCNELIQSAPVHADVGAARGISVERTLNHLTNQIIERNNSQLVDVALSHVSDASFSSAKSNVETFIKNRDKSQNFEVMSERRIMRQVDQNALEQSKEQMSFYLESTLAMRERGLMEAEGEEGGVLTPRGQEFTISAQNAVNPFMDYASGFASEPAYPGGVAYAPGPDGDPSSSSSSVRSRASSITRSRASSGSWSSMRLDDLDEFGLQGFLNYIGYLLPRFEAGIQRENQVLLRRIIEHEDYTRILVPQLREALERAFGPNLENITLEARQNIARNYPIIYEAVLNPRPDESVIEQALSLSRRQGRTNPFPRGGPGRFQRPGIGPPGGPVIGPPGGPPPPPGSLPGPRETFREREFNYDPALVERFISNLSNYDDRYITGYIGYISNVNKNITNYVAHGVTQGVAGNQIFTQREFPVDQLVNDLKIQYGNILFSDYFRGVFEPHIEQLRRYNADIQRLVNLGVNNIQNFLLPIHTPTRPRRIERIPENVISNTNNEIIFQNRPNGGPYSQYLGVYGNIKYPDIPSITITQSKKQIKSFVCTQEGKSRVFKDIHQAKGWALRGGFHSDRIERQRRAAEDKYRLPYEITRKKVNAFVSVTQL